VTIIGDHRADRFIEANVSEINPMHFAIGLLRPVLVGPVLYGLLRESFANLPVDAKRDVTGGGQTKERHSWKSRWILEAFNEGTFPYRLRYWAVCLFSKQDESPRNGETE
jgi:hypothetical protein